MHANGPSSAAHALMKSFRLYQAATGFQRSSDVSASVEPSLLTVSGGARAMLQSRSKPTRLKNRICGWSSRSSLSISEGYAMKLTYDRNHNIAYIRLRPKGREIETIRVSDELN